MTISINNRRRRNGYTLFEILLALGIVAVLLGITVPMMVFFMPALFVVILGPVGFKLLATLAK